VNTVPLISSLDVLVISSMEDFLLAGSIHRKKKKTQAKTDRVRDLLEIWSHVFCNSSKR